MLDEIKIKAFPTSRTVVKNYPLIIKCLNSGAVTVLMMEESKTKDIVLAMLRLENRWGKINLIMMDAGRNELEGNLIQRLRVQ